MEVNRITVYTGPERRQYKRIRKSFMARFCLRHEESEAQPNWHMVTLQNLGAGGALFNYNLPLKIGALVDFKINFPAARQPLDCQAKISRVEDTGRPAIYNLAANFVEIPSLAKELINQSAEEFFTRKPGRIAP
jgi:hypothetical protein